MKKIFLCTTALLICLGVFAQKSKKSTENEPTNERARLKARYALFATCPSKELKKDTLVMDSLLLWKSFYDSIGIKIDISKLQNYVKPDSIYKNLILIASELNSPEKANVYFEKVLNKDKKKVFSKKEMAIRNGDLKASQRSVPDAPPQLYMIWISGTDEPDSATIGELPDTSAANITLTEYLVWQLYNKVITGEFADTHSSTICSDVCKPTKKDGFVVPIATFANGVPKTYFFEPAVSGTNLSSAGARSVKCFVPKGSLDSKKKDLKKK